MNPIQFTILIVDDEKHTRDGLRRLLENEYDVYVAADITGAMNVLEREQIDVLLTDLRLGSEDGMALIDRALKMPRPPICIMMTAYGSVDVAVEAMKRGAYDFVTKPLNLDKVEMLIARAIASRKLEQENRTLRQQVDERYGLENIIGQSLALHEVLDTIKQVAPSSANVLLEGESGTGKELAAHAIHNLSRRNKAKFVTVHSAALSPTLLESELFGHERGAFTGAHARRIGRFEQANHGTIFLDEIGDLSLSTQVKLLRVLQEKYIQRVGGNEKIPVDVRVLAATHRDLESALKENQFREDLFYRLSGVTITLPPLSQRPEDIPDLVKYFMQRSGGQVGVDAPSIQPEAIAFLQNQTWRGNVRELENVVRQALLLARNYPIGLEHVHEAYARTGKQVLVSDQTIAGYFTGLLAKAQRGEADGVHAKMIEEMERELFARAIQLAQGNQAKAARWLGVTRTTMREKLIHFGLHPTGEKQDE